MGFAIQRELQRSVLVQLSLFAPEECYLCVNFSLVVEVIGESAVYLGGSQLREFLKNLFSSKATLIGNHD
jgi:hypothetical protein